LILLPADLLAAALGPKAAAPAFAFHSADAKLLDRVLAETEVVRQPPSPSLTGYVGAWNEAIAHWIVEFFNARPGVARSIVFAVEIAGIAIVVVAVVMLAVILSRRLRPRRAPVEPTPPGWSRVPAAAAAGRDPSFWKSEIEARLARGDVAGALEALWWWLAASLLPGKRVDTSWTTRELFAQARRPELFSMLATLDVLMYGRGAPSAGAVSACVSRLEGILA
jgi:hypothetical protein